MEVPHGLAIADLGSSFDQFAHAANTFFASLTDIGWGYLLGALLLWLALQLTRAHAWANALRAAYPNVHVRETSIAAAFLVGVGINGILPARAGDAAKIVLAKRTVPHSSYPAVISSFTTLAPFDTGIGVLVLLYAITHGLLPSGPRLPRLPAFEISFWAAHPVVLLAVVGGLALAVTVLVGIFAARIESFWQRVKQGLAIFRQPGRYLREVAAWQLLGWLCRFASFWLFLDAFGIGGSVENVLLVMSVQSITGALPFTPGGVGAEQALLVATLGGAPRAVVLSYSVGQELAITAWSVAIAFGVLLLVFRTSDWRGLLREGHTARAEASAK
jgi:uncharacterized membrane protein YbhN (UPF0104 family)